MGAEFTFQDYIDEHGANVIHSWLHTIPTGARQKLNNRLTHLEATPIGQWTRPLVETLDGACAGLFEIRAALQGKQYRILGAHNRTNRTPILMHPFINPGGKVDVAECSQARKQLAQANTNLAKHQVEHNYA